MSQRVSEQVRFMTGIHAVQYMSFVRLKINSQINDKLATKPVAWAPAPISALPHGHGVAGESDSDSDGGYASFNGVDDVVSTSESDSSYSGTDSSISSTT